MVKRYDFSEYANIGPIADGDWVEYEDYEKLADLCGRMAALLKGSIFQLNRGSVMQGEAILAEWEAMK